MAKLSPALTAALRPKDRPAAVLIVNDKLITLMKQWLFDMNEDFSITYTTSGRGFKYVTLSFHNIYATKYYDYSTKLSPTLTELDALLQACEWIAELITDLSGLSKT